MNKRLKEIRERHAYVGSRYNLHGVVNAAAHKDRDELLTMIGEREWQPIETAPKDGTIHIRGLWVTVKGVKAKEFQQFIGFIDEDGDFKDMVYFDDFGWAAKDYTHWMPLPEPPEQDDG